MHARAVRSLGLQQRQVYTFAIHREDCNSMRPCTITFQSHKFWLPTTCSKSEAQTLLKHGKCFNRQKARRLFFEFAQCTFERDLSCFQLASKITPAYLTLFAWISLLVELPQDEHFFTTSQQQSSSAN